MNEFEKESKEKFPKMFVYLNNPSSEVPLATGIDVPEGWKPLVMALCSYLQFLTEKEGHLQYAVEGVKEKFGGLVFRYRYKGM